MGREAGGWTAEEALGGRHGHEKPAEEAGTKEKYSL